jgi:hypothetical protein
MSSTLANSSDNGATVTVHAPDPSASPSFADHEQTGNDAFVCPFIIDIFAEKNKPNGASPSIAPAGHAHDDLPKVVSDTLPTIMHGKAPDHSVIQVANDIDGFLARDLDVGRLNAIHSRMWMCGRPLNARGLHRQQMMERRTVHTEQADLHLLYHGDVIFIKPLPAYLLCPAVWRRRLNSQKLHANAAGFLLSYIWLIRSPLDFTLAEKNNFIPSELTWTDWKILVSEFLKNIDPNSLEQVNIRYHFGELRLGRINTIYRTNPSFIFTHFVRGYLYGYNRYAVFFQRTGGLVVVLFIWFSLILSAMQVGVTVDGLMTNKDFTKACYGFVIFSIVFVAALLAFLGGIFLAVYIYNMFAAIGHSTGALKRRRKLTNEKKTGEKNA